MRSEKFLVTSVIRGRAQVRLWESSAPMAIGHPIRWILEKTEHGARIRSLNGKSDIVQFDEAAIDSMRPTVLPHSGIQVKIRRIRPIRAAYNHHAVEPKDALALQSLVVFSGVRRSVLSSLQVHTAYVAYCKGKPMFTVQTGNDGMKLTLLANKVHLKKKGQPALSAAPGDTWTLTRDELAKSTVTRGWYWWRFNLIAPTAALPVGAPAEEGDGYLKKALTAGLLCLLLFFGASVLLRKPAPEADKEIPVEVPKKSGSIVIYRPKNVSEPKGVAQQQPEAVAPTLAEDAPPKAHAQSAAKPVASSQAKHENLKSRAVRAAESQAKILKDAMGGISNTVKNLMKTETGTHGLSGLFAAKSSIVSPTEVSPGVAGAEGKVGKMGGSENALGYSTGEHGTVSGHGASLVSSGIGGAYVDQGLTKEQVGNVIHQHMNEIRYCHEAAMLGNPGIQGNLTVAFSIGPNGSVESQSVQSTTLAPDTSIQTCLLRRLVTWKFPKPRGGVHVSVSYPFLFKTLSRE
jgi:hypothetical protein